MTIYFPTVSVTFYHTHIIYSYHNIHLNFLNMLLCLKLFVIFTLILLTFICCYYLIPLTICLIIITIVVYGGLSFYYVQLCVLVFFIFKMINNFNYFLYSVNIMFIIVFLSCIDLSSRFIKQLEHGHFFNGCDMMFDKQIS